MSIRRMSAVWEHSGHKGSELLLMLALADSANDIGVCWPGLLYISHKIRMSRRQAMRLVASCNESGELWTLNRKDQRSNVHVVIPGLRHRDIEAAAAQALGMGAVPTTGSDILSPPPQVVEVVTRCHHLGGSGDILSPSSDIAVSPGSDIAMSPDPSLSVMKQEEDLSDPVNLNWPGILRAVQHTMTRATFDRWLRGSEATLSPGNEIRVRVRADEVPEWLDERLARAIDMALYQWDGERPTVRFVAGEV